MIPHIKGRVAHQAHVDLPEGTCEEEYGRNGFSGRYAHFYRKEPPVGWTNIEGGLRPRLYDTGLISSKPGDYLSSRNLVFENQDLRVLFSKYQGTMQYFFRNADADEVFFVHSGSGILETDFGNLRYGVGDYLVIPRGTVYRFLADSSSEFLIVESFSEIVLPDKGMLGQHALFDPAVLKIPELPTDRPLEGEFVVRIQRCGEITSVTYPFYPLNVIGWKGTLSVWQINVKDIRPISSDRYHLPPSAHTTFLGHNFVICTFLPRPLENGDRGALKVPFYHSNIDFDEILFYHEGDFFSRSGVKSGMITFHPQGIHHGPQKTAVNKSFERTHTDEVAVMIDTRKPIHPKGISSKIENIDYWKSWRQNEK